MDCVFWDDDKGRTGICFSQPALLPGPGTLNAVSSEFLSQTVYHRVDRVANRSPGHLPPTANNGPQERLFYFIGLPGGGDLFRR